MQHARPLGHRQQLGLVQRRLPGLRRQFRQVQEANPVACHRPQREHPRDLQQPFHLHHLNEASLVAGRRPELNQHRLGHRGASRLHRLSEVGADLAARLNPEPQPARLEEHRAKRLRQISELHRRRNVASHQKAS